jgi:hypothetical protein
VAVFVNSLCLLHTHADTTGSPQPVEEEPERVELRPYAPGAQEGVRRPWWRRVFGG